MTVSKQYENLISGYLNGNLSEKDQTELLHWIESSPENKKFYLEIKDTWDSSGKVQQQPDVQLLEFYRQAAQSKKIQLWKAVSAVAAMLILGLFIGNLIPFQANNEILAFNTLRVPMGSKSELVLPDGSTVQLNSGSTITYPEKFTGNQRNVNLSGEAFFKVKSDPDNPFIVTTDDFSVLATGTSFNVNNYPSDNYKSATLVEGIVDLQFNNQQKSTRLSPGEKLDYDKQDNRASILKADLEVETAWKEGEFIFKEIPFANLVQRLERWYDVKLIYDDKRFNELKYTGRFKNQETIWQALDALQLTSPIAYERKGFREFQLKYKPM